MGERVGELRWRRALSLKALARRAGVSVDAVHRMEHDGPGVPRPSTIRKVAEALGVDPEYLTEGPGNHAEQGYPSGARLEDAPARQESPPGAGQSPGDVRFAQASDSSPSGSHEGEVMTGWEDRMLADFARRKAVAEGRDVHEVYEEMREQPPSEDEIMRGSLEGMLDGSLLRPEEAERRAREANGHLVGPDPRSKERLPEGDDGAAGEIVAQRSGRLSA